MRGLQFKASPDQKGEKEISETNFKQNKTSQVQ
jgi:hypothetical protein